MEVSCLKMSYVIFDEILNREQIFSDRESNVTFKKKKKERKKEKEEEWLTTVVGKIYQHRINFNDL